MVNKFTYESKEEIIKEIEEVSSKVYAQPTVFPNISSLTVTIQKRMKNTFWGIEYKDDFILKYTIIFDENEKTGYISKNENYKEYQEDVLAKMVLTDETPSLKRTMNRELTRHYNKLSKLLNSEEVSIF